MSTTELKRIFSQKPKILLGRKSTRAILCDVFNNDMAKVNLMLTAYDEGIVDSLRTFSPLTAVEKSRYTKILVKNYAMVDDRVKWAIDTWDSSFDSTIASALDAIEAAQEETASSELEIVPVVPQFDFTAETDNKMLDKSDIENYYVNPTIRLDKNRIYVPCGIGNSDNGFFIYGIKKTFICEHANANAYALVYNYMIRNSRMNDDDIPGFLKKGERLYEIDYRSVFRTAIILLQLIKNNYCRSDVLELAYHGEADNLKTAIRIINTYEALFSRLMGKMPFKLSVSLTAKGIPVSLDGRNGIYACNNDEYISNAREIWYGRKINYNLTKDNLTDLEYILTEISPFDSFIEGQFEALCKMVSANKCSVCIMPTGSGKSLIYYFISILQPLPIFVVSPTDILIQDQLRNLQAFHRIDNVAHLQLTEENSFSCYEIFNSLNYITPTTLQNRNLLVAFRYINKGSIERYESMVREYKLSSGPLLSFVVLDEIHCLSNWGHDFRPEYLMLSKLLNKFLDQITFLGFTATANYTVVEDVQKQLGILQENIISPIAFEKNNISYEFHCVNSQNEMYALLAQISETLIGRNERTIIFTKNDDVSRKVADVVGYEADMFSRDNPEAYHHFVDQKCKVLVASEELGVGINFPNIRNIIHFGLPLSKSEYIQEVGRAGRANEQVHSYIIYLSTVNVPERLLKRDTLINEIPPLLEGLDNDYADAYRKLTNNSPTSDVLYQQLISVYDAFNRRNRALYVETYQPDELVDAKQKIYMLYVVGYINNWYAYSKSKDDIGIDIMIDVNSSETDSYKKDTQKMFKRMRARTRDYFEELGNNRESIAKTDRATSPEEIIRVYVDWYYAKYLYHHNEQFLDLYEFVTNSSQKSEEVTSSIKDYFSLPFIKLKSDEALYNEMGIKEIGNKILSGISLSTLANIERINSNRYSYKLDFLLFAASLKYNGLFEQSRLERVERYINAKEQQYITDYLFKIYAQCTTKGRLAIINYIDSDASTFSGELGKFLDTVYSSEPKDMVYYGFMSKTLNDIFDKSRRKRHV